METYHVSLLHEMNKQIITSKLYTYTYSLVYHRIKTKFRVVKRRFYDTTRREKFEVLNAHPFTVIFGIFITLVRGI